MNASFERRSVMRFVLFAAAAMLACRGGASHGTFKSECRQWRFAFA